MGYKFTFLTHLLLCENLPNQVTNDNDDCNVVIKMNCKFIENIKYADDPLCL